MSRLSNAPLLEVIFELKWSVESEEELNKCQYLHGDLYAKIREKYPHRELLVPAIVPIETYRHQPAHRFRVVSNGYPLVQVGPGILTVNTTDKKYEWKEYKQWILEAVSNLIEVYSFNTNTLLFLSLRYFDFLSFNFNEQDVYKFLSKYLHTDIQQEFYDNASLPLSTNINFNYATEFGEFLVNITKGINRGKEGLILQFNMSNKNINPDVSQIQKWLDEAHQICSDTFKNMTKGKLYETFHKDE
jgi:uncharacterized protein (TIGR04255 family)